MRARAVTLVVAAALVGGCQEYDAGGAPMEPETITVPVVVHDAVAINSIDFVARPRGAQEVPPNNSRARGEAVFELNAAGTELKYKLFVSRIENVMQAHIHNAPVGVNGGIVAWLYPSAPPAVLIPGLSKGLLAQGVITDARVIGGLAGQGVAGLVSEMMAGNTYVNVHTSQFPPGEIRGQIQ